MIPAPPRLVLVLAAAFALHPAPAGAHAFLKQADPAVGSVVPAAPSRLRIGFTEDIEPRFCSIVVTDQAGRRVDDGQPVRRGGDATLEVGLTPLKPGAYEVVWHVVATDTHRTQGSYSFSVAP